MNYSIAELAKLAGISTRTLRYYDEIQLVSPKREQSNGYRVYGQEEVDLLQQILFYRELGVPLSAIAHILKAENYNRIQALEGHLVALVEKKEQIEVLIANVEKTLRASKGEISMREQEKFEGFKKSLVEENERQYGEEIREKYGDQAVDASYAKMMGLTKEQHARTEELAKEIRETLKLALHEGDPKGSLSQAACALHKEWLGYFWKQYSKEAHYGLAETYVADPRFRDYYDSIAEGCAVFFRDALKVYCGQ